VVAIDAAGADSESGRQPHDAADSRSRNPAPEARHWQPVQMFRRLGWGVADQAVSSITNFAVNIYIAHYLHPASEYGAFALAYVTYGFILQVSRGLATDPLLVRFSGTDVRTWRRAVANCSGTAAVVGVSASACVLCAAVVLGGAPRMAFLALGLTLPGLMLQDSWRFAFFALGRGSQAFINDLVWAVALIPALMWLRANGHATVFWFVLAWGAAAALGAAVGPLQARVVPRLSGARSWLFQQRDLGLRYVMEGSVGAASGQLRNYGIAIILTLTTVGYVQAANTLMGPFQVVLFGMGLVALPEASRVLRRSARQMKVFCILLTLGLTLAGLAWGVVLLIALPRGLGSGLLGPIWRPTYPLVLPTTLFVMGGCASAGAGTYMHALGAARRSMRAAVLTSALTVVLGLAGAATLGAAGTIEGAAVAAWTGALLYQWQLHIALRESAATTDNAPATPRRLAGRHRRDADGARLENQVVPDASLSGEYAG
jgi:O-antigen/teichoic acid export membrane protein